MNFLELAKQAKKDGKPHLVKMYFRNHCRQHMKKKKATSLNAAKK